ncbi:MAG: 50S ribosomal protein L10 [Clostridiales bacterium]|nr:MAG: 50S ribosomal protein L10 [Clostridiales bacterium]
MSNNLVKKQQAVSEIHEKLLKAKSMVVVDYMGINVEEATNLRNVCRSADVEYKVYKNNLVKRAVEGTNFEEIVKDLTGPNAFAISYDDATAPARVLKEFAKDSKNFELRSGIIEGTYYDVDGIKKIADIPSREVLVAKLLGSIKSPISNFAYLLKAIADKKEEGSESVEA